MKIEVSKTLSSPASQQQQQTIGVNPANKLSISPLGSTVVSSTNTKMNKIFSTRGGATKITSAMTAGGDSGKNVADPNAKYNSPLAVLSKYGIESLNESQELDDVKANTCVVKKISHFLVLKRIFFFPQFLAYEQY
jgi:hypothetical protein